MILLFVIDLPKKTQTQNTKGQTSPVHWHRMTFLLWFQLPLTKTVRRKHQWSPPAEREI